MIYADTSCLLKVLRPEPLSEAVWSAIDEEASVIVSGLAELETLVQLKAEWTAGMPSRSQWRQAETRFGVLRNQPPFEFRALPAAVFHNGAAPAPEFGRQTLPLPGSLALGSDGRIEGLTLDDPR